MTTHETSQQSERIKIGLIPDPRFGDGVISLVFAHNLQLNDYQVSLYNNPLTKIAGWFKSSTIHRVPSSDQLEAFLSDHDYVISFHITRKHIRIACLGDTLPPFIHENHPDIAGAQANCWEPIAFSQTCIDVTIQHHDVRQPMVENIIQLCQHDALNLPQVTRSFDLIQPKHLTHRKHQQRIVIHPTSSTPGKNWSAKKYIVLARRFKRLGFEPVFALSEQEKNYWAKDIDHDFPVPDLPLPELAELIYESGYFIGNDSGPGHLAACFDVPTLTIYPCKRSAYPLNPGWGNSIDVKPMLPGHLGRTPFNRRSFLTVNKVLRRFNALILAVPVST